MSDFCFFYLLAVIRGVSATNEVLIRPAVQIWVLSTDEAIPSVAGATLTLVHRVAEVADVDAFRMFVAVVGFVLARVLGFTHLRGQQKRLSHYLNLTTSVCLFWVFSPTWHKNVAHEILLNAPQYHPLLSYCCGPGNRQLPVVTRGLRFGCHSMSSQTSKRKQGTGHWSKLWSQSSLIPMRKILSPQTNYRKWGIVLKLVAPERTVN